MFCWLQGWLQGNYMNVFVIQFNPTPTVELGIVLNGQTLKLIRHSPYLHKIHSLKEGDVGGKQGAKL